MINIVAKAGNFKNYFRIVDGKLYKNTETDFEFFDNFRHLIYSSKDKVNIGITSTNSFNIHSFDICLYTNVSLEFEFGTEEEAFYFKLKYGD